MQAAIKEDWLTWCFRSLIGCFCALICFYSNQMSSGLTTVSAHLIESDKRIAAIEVSRNENMGRYQKSLDQIQEMQKDILEIRIKLGSIEQSLANQNRR